MARSDDAADAQRCPAIKKNGERCGATTGPSGYCIGHSPQAQAARAKGGAATSREARALKALPARLRPVANLLTSALVEVHNGTLDPRRASAMAALAGALVRVVSAGELEERVHQLEQANQERLDKQKKGLRYAG